MCTATDEQIKCANCKDNYSSGYRGCKKYQEVCSALKTAATQKISYRDALRENKAAGRDHRQITVDKVGSTKEMKTAPTMERPTVQKQTAETQMKNEQAVQTEEKSARIVSDEQMTTLLRTTVTVMLWIINEMRPSSQQAQVVTQLQTIVEILGMVSH